MTPSQIKRQARKDVFRRIGEVLRDYQTGREAQFEIKAKPVQDKDLSSRLEGPQMKTQQWEPTILK